MYVDMKRSDKTIQGARQNVLYVHIIMYRDIKVKHRQLGTIYESRVCCSFNFPRESFALMSADDFFVDARARARYEKTNSISQVRT